MKTLLRVNTLNGINFYTVGSLEDMIIPTEKWLEDLAKFLATADPDAGPVFVFGPEITVLYDDYTNSYVFHYGSTEHRIIPSQEDINGLEKHLRKFFDMYSIDSGFKIISAS